MRFGAIVKGTRATEPLELPRYDGQPEDQPPLVCKARALNGIELDSVLERARRHAIAKGVDAPEAGEPLYELAQRYETAAIACVDPEDTSANPKPFFDGGADQIRAHFGRDAIVLIYEKLAAMQARFAPGIAKLSPVEWIAGLETLGGDDEKKAFELWCNLGPVLQWSYMRSTALTHPSSPTLRSHSGSSSEAASSETPSSTEKSNEQQSS